MHATPWVATRKKIVENHTLFRVAQRAGQYCGLFTTCKQSFSQSKITYEYTINAHTAVHPHTPGWWETRLSIFNILSIFSRCVLFFFFLTEFTKCSKQQLLPSPPRTRIFFLSYYHRGRLRPSTGDDIYQGVVLARIGV